jgi:hypothetical protein
MPDDVTLNQATVGVGDKVRAVLRSTGTKTQVLGIDVGGEQTAGAPEQLVSDTYPMPINDPYTRLAAMFQAQAAAVQAASCGGAGFYPQEIPLFLVGAQ